MCLGDFDWTKEAERLWNERASFWNSRSRNMWETGSRKDIIPFFQKHVLSNSLVGDLGCGDGYGTFKLMQVGYTVTGVDVSEEMVHKASSIVNDSSVPFLKADIGKLPFDDHYFDAVLAINSLEWTEDPKRVLNEMKRVVKPKGKACIGILGPTAGPRENSYRRLYQEKVVCNTMMPWEFSRLALENGWNMLDEFWVYKKDTESLPKGSISVQMKEAISFMSVFMLENNKT
jgi:ubiquinone/menaquinone biosynthesis C-methylase UbiE